MLAWLRCYCVEENLRARALSETLLLVTCAACLTEPRREPPLPPPGARRAGELVCAGELCRQEHPRLPDTGEWRCAEREKQVWCAGGEPAAGVVPGAPDPSFRCGDRWGSRAEAGERVCVDSRPDYPKGARDEYDCAYQ